MTTFRAAVTPAAVLVLAGVLLFIHLTPRPAPGPAPQPLAALNLEYRRGQAAALRKTADGIDARTLATADAVRADMAAHGKAVVDERDRLLKAACDQGGTIVAPAVISAPLRAAADLIDGGK